MKDSPKSRQKVSSRKLKAKSLFLINDDYNSFDHVVDCLTAICDHDPIQAEQCALLTHYKGSCEIMLAEKKNFQWTPNIKRGKNNQIQLNIFPHKAW